MNRIKLASELTKRNKKKSRVQVGDVREILKDLEEIASEEMIANMDGISDTLEMIAARAREKATKRLNKIAPTSLTKDWKGKKRG